MPITVEAQGMTNKGTYKQTNNIASNPSQYEIENSLCGTGHLLRRPLSI